MTSAAAFIEALQRRLRLNAHRMHPPGEYPPGWQAWFASMAERVGAVTGASVGDMIGVFLARPLKAPPRPAASMTRWQAFSTLWRQQWHPAEPEDRRLHWVAGAVSVLVNLFFAAALLWLMYLQYLGIEPPPAGEDVVQVEFVGRGTPEEAGGGSTPAPAEVAARGQPSAAPTPAEQTESAEPQDERAPSDVPLSAPEFALRPDTATPLLESAPAEVVQRAIPAPQPPAVPIEQPVAVSEPVPGQTQVFVLPQTRKQPVTRELAPRELSARVPEIREVDVATPVQPAQVRLREPTLTAPELRSRMPAVFEREVAEPLRAPTAREIATRPVTVPELRSREPQVRARDVPTPRTATAAMPPAAAPTAPTAPVQASTPTVTPAAAVQTPTAKPGTERAPGVASTTPRAGATAPGSTRPAAASPGTGPKTAPAPGTWNTPSRADDWGASTRNQPGAQRGERPGVFNADGSVKLADAPGSAAPGLPPGTVTEEIADLDRAGTWRKRRPTDYEPTALDKYWVPNETLLAEWVRRSIRRVAIPIPGTSKRVICDVTILAFGGGCGIMDPNLNEQPAEARPPPDVPFKPHLQEDNGSVKRPPGG